MSKGKIKNSIWLVLLDSIKIYFSNIDKFILYMLFPVLGQIIGLILAFGLGVGFADRIAEKATSMSNALLYVSFDYSGTFNICKSVLGLYGSLRRA